MGTEVAVKDNNSIIPMDQVPDYLKGDERTGLETLGQKDYKIPRILLLQGQSPECRAFPGVAIPGMFWHNNANVSLGNKLNMVSGLVSKKAILFKPRWDGGGILAFSGDAVKWDSGANKEFVVHPIDKNPATVTWKTGKDVASSGLLEWGSSNPGVENAPPAATFIYEYLVYLPDHPMLSPALVSVSKTALPAGKALNTTYMMLKRPASAVVIEATIKEEHDDRNAWYVPSFRSVGWANKEIFDLTSKMGKMYENYKVEYTDEEYTKSEAKPAVTGDEIPF